MPGADTRYSNANSARPRRARATIVLAAVAAMALLSSCNWAQPGFGPEGQRYNPFEHTISVANVATLAPAWTVPTDGTIGGPVLDDGGHVYFTRSQGNLVSVRSLSATTGATIWDTNLPTHEMFAIATPAILAGGRVWASRLLPDGTTPTLAVDRLDTATRAIVDSTTAVRIPERLVSGNGVVAAVEYLGTDSAQLVVRDLSTAQQLWASSGLAGSWVIGPISNGVITIMGDEGELRGYPITCGAATCDPLWTRHLQNSVTGRAAAGDRLIVATATRILRDHNGEPMGLDHSTLNALSMTTGETLWTGTNIVSAGGISIAGDTAYVSMSQEPDPMGGLPLGANEIETFAVSGCGGTTCDKLWSAPLPASTLNGILGGGVLFVRVNDQVWVFDAHGCGAATCSKLATLATPPGAVPQSIGGGKLYVTYTEGGVNKLMALAPG